MTPLSSRSVVTKALSSASATTGNGKNHHNIDFKGKYTVPPNEAGGLGDS
jgi:hypothetical protein